MEIPILILPCLGWFTVSHFSMSRSVAKGRWCDASRVVGKTSPKLKQFWPDSILLWKGPKYSNIWQWWKCIHIVFLVIVDLMILFCLMLMTCVGFDIESIGRIHHWLELAKLLMCSTGDDYKTYRCGWYPTKVQDLLRNMLGTRCPQT